MLQFKKVIILMGIFLFIFMFNFCYAVDLDLVDNTDTSSDLTANSPTDNSNTNTDSNSLDANSTNETNNTSNADWFPIDKIPGLGFDHEEILKEALLYLQSKIVTTDILKALFPNEFTIPEIQKTYEAILNKKFDRRNFRKKLLSLDLIEDTNKTGKFEGKKPAKLYKFKDTIESKKVF